MSNQSQSARTAERSETPFSPESIKSLTAKLLELSEYLTAHDQGEPPEPAPQEARSQLKEADQIRCYRVPGFIVQDEREVLAEHQASDLLALLRKAREDVFLTSFLLQNFYEYVNVTGATLQQIGEHLDYPVRILNQLCSILVDYHPQDDQGLDPNTA